MNFRLPKKFEGLESWGDWSLPTERERYQKRAQSSLDEIKAFVAALKPHMEDIIQYLSAFEWGLPLGDEDRNLFYLGMCFMDASLPVDLRWKGPIAQDSFPVDRVDIPER